MKLAFVNGGLAINIMYWEQVGAETEGGARVEMRRVTDIKGVNVGANGFSVASVGDGGVWRADLFVVLTDNGKNCFHYHPKFESGDVGQRYDDPALAQDPRGWVEAKLRDLPGLLEEAGAADLIPTVDLDEHRRALPLMMLAFDNCMARAPVALANR